ncbi:glutamine amidotransferase-like class 1 domain-containing protein 3A, mitochondrial isoform X1 [Amphibalanus amphitrite]|uniref:glutamine amidotransferase-like class 1 domain-containing protein 3A, mitochondrial isoform X1 n=1 Tax=Amphibalanus amphitrite TaxID=1232801 RepID=UPI001C910A0E|nr:glutamine amidotransferase-like class 1 domain-containing protein 3A, mitochondrial isoform X1 [Amphibalanus amphitrite]
MVADQSPMALQLASFVLRRQSPLAGLRLLSSSAAMASPKVAVVLSGCGVYDGTEVHEASACLVHLSRAGADVQCYAPDVKQMHVVDHVKGQPVEGESRGVLQESARIARGDVRDLSTLDLSQADAVVFPGGFGAAKNLSTFGTEGAAMSVQPEAERVLKEFHAAGRPVALCCIAPVLAARLVPGARVTLGASGPQWPYAGSQEAASGWGADVQQCQVDEVCVDEKNRLVTTPAFMYDTKEFHRVFDGVGKMIGELIKMLK